MNLNPEANTWYVLTVAWNGDPRSELSPGEPQAAHPKAHAGSKVPIRNRNRRGKQPVSVRSFWEWLCQRLSIKRGSSQSIFAPLCEGRLYLRNRTKGHRTELEAATEFLRNQDGARRLSTSFTTCSRILTGKQRKIHTEHAQEIDTGSAKAREIYHCRL